ncbi:hypothetical protein VPH35_074585 [Triticum aestivum]
MGLWNYGRKGKHDREAGSSSGRRRGSVKKEEPASPSPPRRAPSPPAFSIAPASAGERDRHYIRAEVCRRYWETRTPIPWSDAHLPNNWHLSADRVPIPPVPVTGRVRRQEIERRRRLLPDDLYYDPRYAPDSPLWDTWFRDEHDARRASYFAGTSTGPRRPRPERRAAAPQERGRRMVRGLTPTPSPSPSPPPPPRMTAEEEARLVQRVMEDSMRTHDERQWDDLEEAMALSAAGDVAFPELQMAALAEERREDAMEEEPAAAFQQLVGTGWAWSCTATEMAAGVGVDWRATPPQSPEREGSPREEVLQAPAAVQPAPVYQAPHAPPAHLWTPPAYVDLVSDDDDIGGQ